MSTTTHLSPVENQLAAFFTMSTTDAVKASILPVGLFGVVARLVTYYCYFRAWKKGRAPLRRKNIMHTRYNTAVSSLCALTIAALSIYNLRYVGRNKPLIAYSIWNAFIGSTLLALGFGRRWGYLVDRSEPKDVLPIVATLGGSALLTGMGMWGVAMVAKEEWHNGGLQGVVWGFVALAITLAVGIVARALNQGRLRRWRCAALILGACLMLCPLLADMVMAIAAHEIVGVWNSDAKEAATCWFVYLIAMTLPLFQC